MVALPETDVVAYSFVCNVCKMSFSVRQELPANAFKKRGVKSTFRRVMSDVACCGWMTDFCLSVDLQNNLAYTPKQKEFILQPAHTAS